MINSAIEFAREWGIDSRLLQQSILNFELSQPDVIPYFEEIIQSVDLSRIENKAVDNLFSHNLKLTAELPHWIADVKSKYN